MLTRRALFLNLFITENCLSLDLTISPNGTFGAFFAFCSQGCSVNIIKDCKYSHDRPHVQSYLPTHVVRVQIFNNLFFLFEKGEMGEKNDFEKSNARHSCFKLLQHYMILKPPTR